MSYRRSTDATVGSFLHHYQLLSTISTPLCIELKWNSNATFPGFIIFLLTAIEEC